MTHRILLIDDNVEFRKSLASHLRSQPGFVVVGELSSDEALFRAVRSAAPDVVLLDIAMPEMDAAAIIRRLRQAVPTAKVIGLSIVPNRRYQDTPACTPIYARTALWRQSSPPSA
jgi:DNA-binding NarL/FixJ family response regulator